MSDCTSNKGWNTEKKLTAMRSSILHIKKIANSLFQWKKRECNWGTCVCVFLSKAGKQIAAFCYDCLPALHTYIMHIHMRLHIYTSTWQTTATPFVVQSVNLIQGGPTLHMNKAHLENVCIHFLPGNFNSS